MKRIERIVVSPCVVGVVGICVLLGACGCAGWSGGRAPVSDAMAYDGPPIEVDSTGPTHQVVMHAPTSGWSFTLDRVDEARGGREAFVTARKPNPSMIYTQAVVEQRIGTGVESGTSLRVLARVQEFTSSPGSGVYRRAGKR